MNNARLLMNNDTIDLGDGNSAEFVRLIEDQNRRVGQLWLVKFADGSSTRCSVWGGDAEGAIRRTYL